MTTVADIAFHPLADIFPMLPDNELQALAVDIKANGLRNLIWLYEGKVLDGRNRFRACQMVGVDPGPFIRYEAKDPLGFVISHNLHRRHLSESQRAMVAAKIANLPQGGDRSKPPIDGLTLTSAAAQLNVGEKSVERAKTVQRNGSPELQAAVQSGAVSVSAAAEVSTLPPAEQTEVVARGEKEIVRRAAEIKKRKQDAKRNKPLPLYSPTDAGRFVTSLDDLTGEKFSCLYVDPPWAYSNQGTRGSTNNHYDTLTVDKLCEMPVGELATDNAHLHLWTTNGFLFECARLFEAWGFTFKSSFVWVKPQIGMGNYWRNSHEFLLLAVKGSLTAQDKSLCSWIEAPRTEHSVKPDDVRSLVERLSPGPRLEMFGRKLVPGWTVFGNEVTQ